MLKPGATIRLSGSGRTARVAELLGVGGQGAVYRVHLDGAQFALKWYHPHLLDDRHLRQRIALAAERGSPDPRFLWPLVLAGDAISGPFGYLMELMPPAYVPIARLFAAQRASRISLSLRDRAAIGVELASAFLGLHAKGLAYQDINFGSLMFEPGSTALLICDNDNVDVDGAPATSLGTPKFMAPEIVRGEASPTTDTDLHSLAVVLFYLLFLCHPLEGRLAFANGIVGPDTFMRLFGTSPRFVFDAENPVNGPVPGRHDAQARLWQTMTPGLKKLFARAFGRGLCAPRQRVLETEWLKELSALRDAVCTCPDCGFETPASADCCAWCRLPHARMLSLTINRKRIILEPGAKLYLSPYGQAASTSLTGIAATVVSASPEAVLIRNLSDRAWRVGREGHDPSASAPGEDTWLRAGDTIAFQPDCIGTVAT